jgi:hypothetical protein
MMCLGEAVVNTKLRMNIIRTKKEMGLQEVSRNITKLFATVKRDGMLVLNETMQISEYRAKDKCWRNLH